MGKHILRLSLVTLAGVIASILFLVYTAPLVVKDSSRSTTESIFVYGTLQNELVRFYACRCLTLETPMTLKGFKKLGLNIVPSATSVVEGDVIRVTPQQLKLIDAYENVPEKYSRSTVTIEGREYFVYIKNE